MSKWPMAFIGDICEILDSQRKPVTASDRSWGIYPYYGANGIQDFVDNYIFDDELVLLAEDGGNFGSKEKPIAYRVSGKCWVNNHAHVLKPKDMLDVDYLCYALMFYDVSNLISGTTRAKLNQSAVRKMQIALPPLEIQKKITDMLDKAKSLIDLRKKQIEKIDLLVKSKFIEMFGDPVTNPMGWKKATYGELCRQITDGEHVTPKREKNGIFLLSARNIINHDLQLDDVDFINESEFIRISRRLIPKKDDILISCSGSVGRVCRVPENFKAQLVRSVAILKLKENINAIFMEYLIDTDFTRTQINQSVNQSSQANLFQNKIRKLVAIVPPINIQTQFASFVESVEKQKTLLQQGLDKMEMNYKALMQEYFG